MTREEAKELLPIIQAFAEGKTIEIGDNIRWKDLIVESPKLRLPTILLPHQVRTKVLTIQKPRRVLE